MKILFAPNLIVSGLTEADREALKFSKDEPKGICGSALATPHSDALIAPDRNDHRALTHMPISERWASRILMR